MTFAPYDEGYKIKTVLTEVDFQKLLAGLLNCDWPNHVPSRCYCRTNLQACLFRIAPPISLFCQRNGWSACFLICVAGFHDMLSKICCNSFRKERRNLKGKKKKTSLESVGCTTLRSAKHPWGVSNPAPASCGLLLKHMACTIMHTLYVKRIQLRKNNSDSLFCNIKQTLLCLQWQNSSGPFSHRLDKDLNLLFLQKAGKLLLCQLH